MLSNEEFEKKLADYLVSEAAQQERTVDQLRNEVAYERFLARMNPNSMTIKGGYAVKSQVPVSPYTKDIDLILMGEKLPLEKDKLPRAVREVINDQLERVQIDDHFRFDTGEALGFADLEPRDAAARIAVRAYVGSSQERFATFPLDVATTDGHVLPPKTVTAPNHLSWASIESAQVSVAAPEYLFADKLLIYVESRNKNRIGDVAHMALLAEKGVEVDKVAWALNQLSKERGLQAKILEPLSEPPKDWSETFNRIMPQVKNLSIDKAFDSIKKIHQKMIAANILGKEKEMDYGDRQANSPVDDRRTNTGDLKRWSEEQKESQRAKLKRNRKRTDREI